MRLTPILRAPIEKPRSLHAVLTKIQGFEEGFNTGWEACMKRYKIKNKGKTIKENK